MQDRVSDLSIRVTYTRRNGILLVFAFLFLCCSAQCLYSSIVFEFRKVLFRFDGRVSCVAVLWVVPVHLGEVHTQPHSHVSVVVFVWIWFDGCVFECVRVL